MKGALCVIRFRTGAEPRHEGGIRPPGGAAPGGAEQTRDGYRDRRRDRLRNSPRANTGQTPERTSEQPQSKHRTDAGTDAGTDFGTAPEQTRDSRRNGHAATKRAPQPFGRGAPVARVGAQRTGRHRPQRDRASRNERPRVRNGVRPARGTCCTSEYRPRRAARRSCA